MQAVPTDWTQLAAMLTVMAICGSFFTFIVALIIESKMSKFEKSMQKGFVTKEVHDLLQQNNAQKFHEIEQRLNSGHTAGHVAGGQA